MPDPASGIQTEYATAGGYRYKSLDMDDPADVELFLKSERRFPTPPGARQAAIEAAYERFQRDDETSPTYMGHFLRMEAMNQADEHALLSAQTKSPQSVTNTQVNISTNFEAALSPDAARLMAELLGMVKDATSKGLP